MSKCDYCGKRLDKVFVSVEWNDHQTKEHIPRPAEVGEVLYHPACYSAMAGDGYVSRLHESFYSGRRTSELPGGFHGNPYDASNWLRK